MSTTGSNLGKDRVLCVRARKCSDTLLKSETRYYFLSKPCKLYGTEERFYVLDRDERTVNRNRKFTVRYGLRI